MPVLHLALSVRAVVFEPASQGHFRRKIMFQNAVIDVAIGLILMYLMLSLLCTTVNEFIATKLSIRANTLRDALKKLIDDPTLLTNFYQHGLIASNSRASGTGSQSTLQAVSNAVAGSPPAAAGAAAPSDQHPSYLASATVALAIMDSLVKQTPGATANVSGVQTAIAALPDSKIKDSLEATLLKAGEDIHKLEKGIATWFDDAMDRLSGAYKRKMKWIAMLIGLLIAIAFNADSFNVATTLWNDPDRRASTIAIATEVAKKLPASAQPSNQQELNRAVTDTEKMLRSLPIGWDCPAKDKSVDYWSCAKDAVSELTLVHFLGWVLTALALSLGAPFWFDLLNKFINLRGAGVKPKREDGK
jgi:hypothetical protein